MAAELKIGIGVDDSGLSQGLKSAEAKISGFLTKIDGFAAIGDKLQGIGQKLTLSLTAPILGLGVAAVKSFGDIQSLKMGLEAVMGSASSASSEFNKLKEVAKLPGLGLQEAVKGSVALQSAGFSAEEARRSLMAFGNALATVGKGANELGFVNLALTQIQNKTGGFGQDLRQLTEQLPQLRGAMEAAFGTVDSEEVANLGYTGKQVVQMLTAEFEKLPKVTGGIKNAFENLRDSTFVTFSRIGEILDKNLDISGIVDKITSALDSLVSWFESLSPAIQKTILVVGGLVAAAGPLIAAVGAFLAMLPTMLTGIGAVGTALTALTGPIGLVVVGIGAIIAAVVTNWDKIKPYIVNTINWFRELYNESTIVRIGVVGLAAMFRNSFAVITNIVKTAWEVFKSFAKNTADLFAGVGSVIKGALSGNFTEIKAGLGQMATAWTNGLRDVGNDLKTGINNLWNDVGNNVSNGIKQIANNEKLQPITDLKIFDSNKITENTEKKVTQGVQKGLTKAKEKIGIALEDFGQVFKQNLNTDFVVSNPLDSLFTEEQIKAFEGRMAEYTPRLITPLTDAQIAMQEQGIRFQQAVEGLIGDGVVEGLSQAFEAMGGAIAQGGNILQAAGGAILGVLGQFMQMLGKEMIKLAVATIALGNLVSGIKKWIIANPGAAIALAGIAIVAGTLLSAAGSNIGGGSSGGGSYSTSSGNSSQSFSSNYSSGGNSGTLSSGTVVFEIEGQKLVGVLSNTLSRNKRLGGSLGIE